MATIPPPPFLGPLTGVPVTGQYPDWVNLFLLRWDAKQNNWITLNWGQHPWDSFPSGYYASEHIPADGNVDWGPNSTVIVVAGRSRPDGTAAPFVLEEPPAAQLPDPRCPPNMWWTNIGDTFSVIGGVTLCSWLPPPPQQVCPEGTYWDAATETCKAISIPPPIIFPPIPPPPPPAPVEAGQPDPYGDEITQTLCAQMAADAASIVSAIQGLQQNQGGPGVDQCCAAVVTAIGAVAHTLASIFGLLNATLGSAGAPLDLTQIVTELTAMAASLNALATAPAMDLAPLTAAINDVARAIASAAPPDVSGIVQQLANLVREGDVKKPILDSLLAEGYITSEDAQVLTGSDWADAITRILRTAFYTGYKWIAGVVGVDISTGKPIAKPIGETVALDFERAIIAAFAVGSAPVYQPIKGVIAGVLSALQPSKPPTLFSPNIDTDLLLAKTLVPALGANAVAYVMSYFGWEIQEVLKDYVDKVSEFAGIAEIAEVQVGQRMRFGPMRQAEASAKAFYMQELPGVGEVAGWAARGLIDKPTAETVMKFNGRHTEIYPNTLAAAQHGMSPRIMLRLIDTGLFADAEIADELTFSGMRPASQHRMLLAARYLATQPQRHALKAAYEVEYREGLIGQVNLLSLLDAAEHNTDGNDLILRRVNSQILVDETKLLIAQYALLFKGGVYSDAQFRGQLAAIGLEQWKIDLEAGKAEAAANVATFKKNLAAAAALERATVAEERKAAMEGFKSGALNAASLAAALVLTGLTPTQSAAWVSLAGLQQSGALRWIYGLLRSPAEAGLLRARVAALADQRKRLQIDDPAFVGALQAMGIPDRYINALRAATDALITPKTAAVTIPVQTT